MFRTKRWAGRRLRQSKRISFCNSVTVPQHFWKYRKKKFHEKLLGNDKLVSLSQSYCNCYYYWTALFILSPLRAAAGNSAVAHYVDLPLKLFIYFLASKQKNRIAVNPTKCKGLMNDGQISPYTFVGGNVQLCDAIKFICTSRSAQITGCLLISYLFLSGMFYTAEKKDVSILFERSLLLCVVQHRVNGCRQRIWYKFDSISNY